MEASEFFDADISNVFQTEESGQVVEGEELEGEDQELAALAEIDVQEQQELITTENITDEQLSYLQQQPIFQQPEVELSLEDQLKSNERLDRSSPDLWPQNMPTSAQQIFSRNNIKSTHLDSVGTWAQGLDPEDINLLHQFGSLTSSSLVEEVKKLQNIAYQLGLEEGKELTRGRLLHTLDKQNGSLRTKNPENSKQLWK